MGRSSLALLFEEAKQVEKPRDPKRSHPFSFWNITNAPSQRVSEHFFEYGPGTPLYQHAEEGTSDLTEVLGLRLAHCYSGTYNSYRKLSDMRQKPVVRLDFVPIEAPEESYSLLVNGHVELRTRIPRPKLRVIEDSDVRSAIRDEAGIARFSKAFGAETSFLYDGNHCYLASVLSSADDATLEQAMLAFMQMARDASGQITAYKEAAAESQPQIQILQARHR